MTENTDVNSLGAALLDRDDGLHANRGSSRSNGVAFYVPTTRDGGGIHSQLLSAQQVQRPEPIYYCATGGETPLYEPCKDRKDQGDI
jgi:hypothetical protein